ncbi:hypothetical protein AB0B54_24385 [Microbispora bryophytorum]|uniref:hypothetical protein n=1 Tax=Microbispora bryophytorum TaxID=1460882 RepID=UPI0033C90BA0
MSLASLTFNEWRGLELAAATRIAEQAAAESEGRLDRVESVEHLGTTLHRVLIERDGQVFSLIPGGKVTVGFDLAAWQPAPDMLDCYREQSLSQGYGFDPDLRVHLGQYLSPRRTVTVPTLLMAVEDEPLTAPPEEMPTALTSRGLRLPHPDEWEHACGAGAATLFRWGDWCPLDRIPYGDKAGPQHQPNAFGLRIADSVYSAEVTSDPDAIHGGDGGEAVCGGYGTLLAWLPLATANHNPSVAEFVHGPDGEDMYEDFSTRPVIDLR